MNLLLAKAKTDREYRELLAVIEDYWEAQLVAPHQLRDSHPQSPEE